MNIPNALMNNPFISNAFILIRVIEKYMKIRMLRNCEKIESALPIFILRCEGIYYCPD